MCGENYVLKLWLCEPLYLPALRATFLQRKACMVPLQLPARIVRDPLSRSLRSRQLPFQGSQDALSRARPFVIFLHRLRRFLRLLLHRQNLRLLRRLRLHPLRHHCRIPK